MVACLFALTNGEKIGASPAILSLTEGAGLEFSTTPPLMLPSRACDSAQGVGVQKSTQLQTEVRVLKDKHAIERAPASLSFYARLLLVPMKNGKMRPVFNIRPLIRFVANSSFKMVTLKMVVGTLGIGDFAASLDLSEAYFHVWISPASQCFLHFKFENQLWQFRAMPFGLCSAPHIFTKRTCPVTLFCCKLGICIIFYLDNSIIMARSKDQLIAHWDFVLCLFQRPGFFSQFAEVRAGSLSGLHLFGSVIEHPMERG